MRQNKRKVNLEVKLLEDLEPNYVSLVDHGANQTPFRIIKSYLPGSINFIKKSELDSLGLDIMTTEVQRYVFSKESWTQETVQEYLTTKDFEGFHILEADVDYTVVNKAESLFKELHEINQEEGLTAYVGEPVAEEKTEVASDLTKENDTPNEGEPSKDDAKASEKPEDDTAGSTESEPEEPKATDEEDEEKEAEDAVEKSVDKLDIKKFDFMAAYMAEPKDFNDFVKAGADGMGIGYGDMLEGFILAYSSALKSNSVAAMDKNYNQFKEFTLNWARKNAELVGMLAEVQTEPQESQFSANSDISKEGTATALNEITESLKGLKEAISSSLEAQDKKLNALETKLEETVKSQTIKLEERVKSLEDKPLSRKSVETSKESTESTEVTQRFKKRSPLDDISKY